MDRMSWDALGKARHAFLQENAESPLPWNEAYEILLGDDREALENYYRKNKFMLMSPITVSRDTALHLAVYSKKAKPLKTLLDIIKQGTGILKAKGEDVWSMTTSYGNTILHEAVIAGNFEAVKLLVPKDDPTDAQLKQIRIKNYAGETPLFTAASFGRRKILAYILDEFPAAVQTPNNKLRKIHRQRDDKKSILLAAIEGQRFVSALLLLYKYPELNAWKDSEGLNCLLHLSAMPSAFKSGSNMGVFSKFIYSSLNPIRGNFTKMFKGWPMVEEIWKQKRKHESAVELVRLLVRLNKFLGRQPMKPAVPSRTTVSAESSLPNGQRRENNAKGQRNTDESLEEKKISPPSTPLLEVAKATLEIHHPEVANELGQNIVQATIRANNEVVQPKTQEECKENKISLPQNPLFTAISKGVLEAAEAILEINPHAIEFVNDQEQNILHLAVLHRQLEIFRFVKKKSILLDRMNWKIDKNGYSLLHQAADMTHYRGGTKPSPAHELQEEFKWFKRVEKIAPPHHVMHRDKIEKMTAMELFLKQHQDQLKMASKWIENTSQSCSAVAVLVATVVFAAAYTIPGGSNDYGFPIFLHSRFFLAFTVLDVIALASSLTSVVMFLSILTTPFECEKFHKNIPRKLLWGLTLLFFSVMTTMLAFGCTLFLIIRFRKQYWIAGLMSIAAFIPVLVFVVMQFSLYIECMKSLKEICIEITRFLPCYPSKRKCLPCFGSRRGDNGDKKWFKKFFRRGGNGDKKWFEKFDNRSCL